jgi:hypothetical protein
MNKKQLIYVFIILFLFSIPYVSATDLSDMFKNSIGIISFTFENVRAKDGKLYHVSKECNGILIKKNNKKYFISVLHLSKIFKNKPLKNSSSSEDYLSNLVTIQIPNKIALFPIAITKDNFFDGDDLPPKKKKKQNGFIETIDICCIDVTNNVSEENIITYDLLAGEDKKSEIDSSQGNILVCGYPGAKPDKGCEELPSTIQQPINFGTLYLTITKEKPSGFRITTELKEGDCGRPIIMKIGTKNMVIGLYKGYENDNAVVDSTAVMRVIDYMYNKITPLNN